MVVLGHPVVVVVVVVVARTVGLKDCAQSGLGKAFLGSYLPSKIGQAKSNIRQKTRTSAFLMKEYVRFLTTEKLLIPRGYVLVSCVSLRRQVREKREKGERIFAKTERNFNSSENLGRLHSSK